MDVNSGEKTNSEFLIVDSDNNIINGNLNINYVIYEFLTMSNKLPNTLKFESEKNLVEKELTINNFQTGFEDLTVNTVVQGYLTVDDLTYTIVIYNIDWNSGDE